MFGSPQLDLVPPITAKELSPSSFFRRAEKLSMANPFRFILFRTLCTNQTLRKLRISRVFSLLRTLAKTMEGWGAKGQTYASDQVIFGRFPGSLWVETSRCTLADPAKSGTARPL